MLQNTPEKQFPQDTAFNSPINQFPSQVKVISRQQPTKIKGGNMTKKTKYIDFHKLTKKEQIKCFEGYREALYEYYVTTYSVKETTSYEANMVNREIDRLDRWISLMHKMN